jgi:lipopolysaccharide transport system ATP-binding protein
MTFAIRAEGLGKLYRLGLGYRHDTLRDALVSALAGRLGRATPRKASAASDLWALRDVSFEIATGEVVGIIGGNGAGKSTLLKILSRITVPTTGRAAIRGRVGSLLEVGTGFHPELTGRENVYLNGALLGMRRAEIQRRFDEIVAFAEVERFLDTPVKRYSTGMYMRLAFAVAAHLEPEVLLVDEVLAVGDAPFQRKCLGKMGETAAAGRTVLFVSHNMTAVQTLCRRAIYLAEGRVRADGPAREVVRSYVGLLQARGQVRSWPQLETAPGNQDVRLTSAAVRALGADVESVLTTVTPFELEFCFRNLGGASRLDLSLHLHNEEGTLVFSSPSLGERNWGGRPLPSGRYRAVCRVPGGLLNQGNYRVDLWLVKDRAHLLHKEADILSFEVGDDVEGRDGWFGEWPGVVRPQLPWTIDRLAD